MSKALEDVSYERRRQLDVEGFDDAHDDAYRKGELARAASHYAAHASAYNRVKSDVMLTDYRSAAPLPGWPWERKWWKPKNPRCDLVRAAALIIAEIERMDRAAASVHQ